MPCNPMYDEKGNVIGISCTRGKPKKQVCYVCGKPMSVLCDAPSGGGGISGTCDKPMCKEHSYRIGIDNDVCELHYNEINIAQAKSNREYLDKQGWKKRNSYICSKCSNEEFSPIANFCKICGLKIERVEV